MIPVALVTGFLGSGKTTLLRHVAAAHRGRRLVFLVNEFAPVDVDGRLLAAEGARVVALPGGSIFCQCLVGSFIEQLRGIAERFHRPAEPLDGLVIEASGIADPNVAARMLRETRLDEIYQLRRIVSVVDPGSFVKLLHMLPSITAQIEASDLAVLNKVDLFDEAALAEVERQISAIKPNLAVVRAAHCRVDSDLFGERHAGGSPGAYAPGADPHFARLVLTMGRPVDLGTLVHAIRSAGEAVYRAKGFVPTRGGMVCLDCSASGVATSPAPADKVAGLLAVICHPASRFHLAALLAPWGDVRTVAPDPDTSPIQLGLPNAADHHPG